LTIQECQNYQKKNPTTYPPQNNYPPQNPLQNSYPPPNTYPPQNNYPPQNPLQNTYPPPSNVPYSLPGKTGSTNNFPSYPVPPLLQTNSSPSFATPQSPPQFNQVKPTPNLVNNPKASLQNSHSTYGLQLFSDNSSNMDEETKRIQERIDQQRRILEEQNTRKQIEEELRQDDIKRKEDQKKKRSTKRIRITKTN